MTKPKDFQNFLVTDNLRIKDNLYDFGVPCRSRADFLVSWILIFLQYPETAWTPP